MTTMFEPSDPPTPSPTLVSRTRFDRMCLSFLATAVEADASGREYVLYGDRWYSAADR